MLIENITNVIHFVLADHLAKSEVWLFLWPVDRGRRANTYIIIIHNNKHLQIIVFVSCRSDLIFCSLTVNTPDDSVCD